MPDGSYTSTKASLANLGEEHARAGRPAWERQKFDSVAFYNAYIDAYHATRAALLRELPNPIDFVIGMASGVSPGISRYLRPGISG